MYLYFSCIIIIQTLYMLQKSFFNFLCEGRKEGIVEEERVRGMKEGGERERKEEN